MPKAVSRVKKPEMTSYQYEALCRFFLADLLGKKDSEIRDGRLLGQSRARDVEIRHQIDMFWYSTDGVCRYFNIANAKRHKRKVELTQVMTLLGVMSKVDANKGVMFSPTGFARAALKQAKESRLALYVVRPKFDYSGLHKSNATAAVKQLRAMTSRRRVPIWYECVVMTAGIPRHHPARVRTKDGRGRTARREGAVMKRRGPEVEMKRRGPEVAMKRRGPRGQG